MSTATTTIATATLTLRLDVDPEHPNILALGGLHPVDRANILTGVLMGVFAEINKGGSSFFITPDSIGIDLR